MSPTPDKDDETHQENATKFGLCKALDQATYGETTAAEKVEVASPDSLLMNENPYHSQSMENSAKREAFIFQRKREMLKSYLDAQVFCKITLDECRKARNVYRRFNEFVLLLQARLLPFALY